MNIAFRYARVVVDLFGLAAIWSVCFVVFQSWRLSEPFPFQGREATPLATKFSEKVSPEIQRQVNDNRERIIASADGWATRTGLRMGWTALVNLIPRVIRAGFDALMDLWGQMNIREIASMLLEHSRQRGMSVHPSVRAAARGGG